MGILPLGHNQANASHVLHLQSVEELLRRIQCDVSLFTVIVLEVGEGVGEGGNEDNCLEGRQYFPLGPNQANASYALLLQSVEELHALRRI